MQDYRGSSLSVRMWNKQEEINVATYYRAGSESHWLLLNYRRAPVCRL